MRAWASEIGIPSHVTLRVGPARTSELMGPYGNCGPNAEPEDVSAVSLLGGDQWMHKRGNRVAESELPVQQKVIPLSCASRRPHILMILQAPKRNAENKLRCVLAQKCEQCWPSSAKSHDLTKSWHNAPTGDVIRPIYGSHGSGSTNVKKKTSTPRDKQTDGDRHRQTETDR